MVLTAISGWDWKWWVGNFQGRFEKFSIKSSRSFALFELFQHSIFWHTLPIRPFNSKTTLKSALSYSSNLILLTSPHHEVDFNFDNFRNDWISFLPKSRDKLCFSWKYCRLATNSTTSSLRIKSEQRLCNYNSHRVLLHFLLNSWNFFFWCGVKVRD